MVDISILKNKSQSNKEAGLLLFSNEYYNSSIHCFYYSCLQLSIFTLVTKFHLTYETLKGEARAGKNNSNHYYINRLITCITDSDLKRDYTRTMNSLKSLRKDADYEPYNFAKSTCSIANTYLIDIENILNKIQ